MSREEKIQFGGAALLSLALICLFPGDVPFVNDEALLLEKVWRARETGMWWIPGLTSMSGISYGPLPLLVYRLFLSLTDNPIYWVWMKAIPGQLIVIFALAFAVEHLRLNRWAAIFTLFSPHLYLYQRVLWDNCFLVPLALVAAVSTVRYLQTGQARAFACLCACAVAMIHVHLMALLLLVPIALGLGRYRPRWLTRTPELLALSLAVLACLPYGMEILRAPRGPGYAGAVGPVEGLGAALTAARWLSFPEFFSYFFPGALEGPTGWALRLGVTLLFAVVGVAAWGMVVSIRTRRQVPLWQWQWESIGLAVLAVVFVVHWAQRIKFHPHYANATWPVYLWFFSRGWTSPPRWIRPQWLKPATALQGGILGIWIFLVHHSGGDRQPRFGATLENQIEVARSLGKAPPDAVEVKNYQLFPHTLEFLQQRLSSPDGRRSAVRYRDPEHTGWIEAGGDRG